MYKIGHKFKPTVILPIIALQSNWEFLMSNEDKEVLTADGIECKVLSAHLYHICELEEDIQNIYGITAWDFVKKWYKYDKDLDNMHFLRLDLKQK